MKRICFALMSLCAALSLTACGEKAPDKKAGAPPTPITVTQVKTTPFEVVEETVGTLESVIDPKLSAEVAGRVTKLLTHTGQTVKKGEPLLLIDPADLALQSRAGNADAKRLEALLTQQDKLVARQQQLVQRNFISQNALDEVKAQRDALHAQLEAARARADEGRRSLGKAQVVSPIDGVVQTQFVSPGEYVKVGDPLYQLISNRRLRAHLPFPESASVRMKIGLPVRITSPQVPGIIFEGKINDIKPSINETSRAIDVIVDLQDERFRGGGTVNAAVIVATQASALTVPEQSVVLRPAGRVLYAIVDGKAQQRIVETGSRRGGLVEIVSGLKDGETIALDGAGFLTQDAAVAVQERGEKTAPKKP